MTITRFLLPAFLALGLSAQTETGQIGGFVTDELGKAVPAATITIAATSKAGSRTARTSRDGAYTIAAILPGSYRVAVAAEGFSPASRNVQIHTGSTAVGNFRLERALTGAQRLAGGAPENGETGGESQVITQQEIAGLPNLIRNVFWFSGLWGNVSGAGLGTRGVGLAINGQRESSTNILLDGAASNNEFFGAIGQQIPIYAVQEFSISTTGFSARYGRATGGIVSVATNSGSDRFHGDLYEFLRLSALTGNTFLANAEALPRPVFDGNDFGYSIGGPLVRRRLYFFNSSEGRTIRSEATDLAWVASPQLLAQTPPNTQAFFQALGQLRGGASVIGSTSLDGLTAPHGGNPCTGLACEALPAALPLFLHVAYRVPSYSPAGWPQNTAQTFGRIDYHASDATWIYARYALYREFDPAGSLSSSPYSNYDLGRNLEQDTSALSLLHAWSRRWTSEITLDFSRLGLSEQGLTNRGLVPAMYANPFSPVTIGTDPIVFPGYNPLTPGSGGSFGGPENQIQFSHETTFAKGRHLIRLGAAADVIRDNVTDAAYQTAVGSLSAGGGVGPALNGLLSGVFAHFQVAIYPQREYPCFEGIPAPACTVTLPAGPPAFSRDDRYNDGSLYVEDTWKAQRRLTVNLGLRWEHFGVQHDEHPNLDSNWYLPQALSANATLATYLRQGGLQLAWASPVGGLWKPDWKDFAPRAGIAWDVFGNGSTAFRAGFGIGYERNFDNVTFNILQNPPNYAVLDVPGPITTVNLGSLAAPGTLVLPPLGARIIDPDLKTAYASFWNASLERKLTRAIVYRVEYSGSKGVHLYSISYPNQAGFGNLIYGDNCIGIGDCGSQPNSDYNENVGYRGNQGFSIYHAINNNFTITNLFGLGISLTANYTWSHAIDNLSSTFFEAGGQGVASQYGDQNITTNNGDFVAGLLDPFDPGLDRGDSEFDIRHRVVVSGQWAIPSVRRFHLPRALTRGWSLNPIFLARSGQPFSVFDSSQQTLDLNTPRAAFTGPHPTKRNTFVPGPSPDSFHLLTFLPAQILRQANVLTYGAQWPAGMSARDSFRAPGFWNLDLGAHKDTPLGERCALEFRADFFNFFNHANLYIIGTSADLGKTNTVDGCFGCTGSSYDERQIQLAIRLKF